MKVLKRVLEKRIRCLVSIDNMQFDFMPGKGTADAIFHQATSTRETPSREKEAVLCCCGFIEGI